MGRQIDLFGKKPKLALVPDLAPEEVDQKIRALGGVGILSPNDIKELGAGSKRVYNLMRDGQWHLAQEIRMAAGSDGVEASEGLRRMRELRTWYDIQRRKDTETGRLFWYRLIPYEWPL